jgi:hypothetical protein
MEMQQSRRELKAELDGYWRRLDEIEGYLEILYEAKRDLDEANSQHGLFKLVIYRVNSQIERFNREANDLLHFIGLVENLLIGHNVQYFGKCRCVACKEGIYD